MDPRKMPSKIGGCGDMLPQPQALHIFITSSDGIECPVAIDGKRVLLAKDGQGTPLWVKAGDPGTFMLESDDGPGIEADSTGVRATMGAATPLVVEPVSGKDGQFRLRTKDNLYLASAGPGESLLATKDPNHSTAFKSRIAPAATPRFFKKFAAEPGAWNDETRSTHLWIFNRAVELINSLQSDASKNLEGLRYCLREKDFVDAIKQGIDAADNTGKLDKETSGFIFSAHFYHPTEKRGGYWDPDASINALNYGTRYFRESVAESDLAASGRKLGLSIHYLQDLCQPMHSGLFPNGNLVLQGLWTKLGISAALLWSVPLIGQIFLAAFVTLSVTIPDYRHANYELWILSIQNFYGLKPEELRLQEFNFKNTSDWWQFAADTTFKEYEAWDKINDSPDSKNVYFRELTIPEAANLNYSSWLPSTILCLKLAQRLTTGLLVAWADAPAKVVTDRAPVPSAPVYLVNAWHSFCISTPVHEFGDDHVCIRPFDQLESWDLKPVMNPDGKPKTANGLSVYQFRSKRSNKFVVAQWSWHPEGWVYYQTQDMHENAEWVFEPALDAHGQPLRLQFQPNNKSYPLFRIRDLMHKMYLGASPGAGPLKHFGSSTNGFDFHWAMIPIGEV